jgi:hypothetical protein
MSFNGGGPAQEDVEAGRWGLPVHGFDPIKYGRLPIERLIEDMGAIEPEDETFGSWAPGCYVPFAHDEGGSPPFLALRDTTLAACIYPPGMAATLRVARSFAEFCERLYREKSA